MKTWLSRVLVMFLLLALMLPAAAFAQTEEEFILTCSTKIVAEAEMFTAGLDESGKKTVYTAVGTLAEGSYVRCTGNEDAEAGYVECLYYVDGALQSAWLKADALGAAWTLVYFEDGGYVKLHDTIVKDPQALSDYCATYFPDRKYTFEKVVVKPPVEPDAMLAADWASAYYGEEKAEIGVKLVTLGLINSVVEADGETLYVPTGMLTFDGAVDSDHHVGVVFAPRTGEASLRAEASGSGTMVETCKTGRIVAVLEYTGATYTKILYDGKEGYIRTDCLIFPDVQEETVQSGVLHVSKKIDGADLVTVRSNTSTSSAKVGTWATGTNVAVYGEQGSWYAIEVDGWYGLVQQKYLMMVDNSSEE